MGPYCPFPKSVIISHSLYGCDTGCCGWSVVDADDEHRTIQFEFKHPRRIDISDDAALIDWARDEFDIPVNVEVSVGEWRECSS